MLAEIELESPGTLDMSGEAADIDIELDEMGGAVVDFDPMSEMPSGDFYENLAENMDERELGAVASELTADYDAKQGKSPRMGRRLRQWFGITWVQLLRKD